MFKIGTDVGVEAIIGADAEVGVGAEVGSGAGVGVGVDVVSSPSSILIKTTRSSVGDVLSYMVCNMGECDFDVRLGRAHVTSSHWGAPDARLIVVVAFVGVVVVVGVDDVVVAAVVDDVVVAAVVDDVVVVVTEGEFIGLCG